MKSFAVILFSIFLMACSNPYIDKGRNAYTNYYKENLRDPVSFEIHSEKVMELDKREIQFILDYSAMNGFGGKERMIDTIVYGGNRLIINGEIVDGRYE